MNTNIVNLGIYVNAKPPPTLVLVDLQQEYLASPRALALPDPTDAVANCRAALSHAREIGCPVAFTRFVSNTPFFNRQTRFSRWIEGFEPCGTDLIFERDQPSCYASKHFSDIVTDGGGHFILAGLAGETACLSTAVEAFHRRHSFTYLADASACHALRHTSAEGVHDVVSQLIGLWGDVTTTQSWIQSTSRSPMTREVL